MTASGPARLIVALLVAAGLAAHLAGQPPPPTPLRLLTPGTARPLPTVLVNDVEMVALDELASAFGITVREDSLTRALTVGWRGSTIVLTPDQSLASVGGRLLSLPAAPAQVGGRWHVPVEFIARALAPLADRRLELRKASRMVLYGDLRVPRVVVRHDTPGPQARVTVDITPATPRTVTQQANELLVRFEADAIDVALPPVVSQGIVEAIRVADDGAALAIQLGPKFGSFRSTEGSADATGTRLTIDLFPAGEPAGPPATTATAPPPTPPLPVPAAGLRTIVIDAGHGGDETGAKGAGGTLEKDVTLSVARRLRGAIESRLGVRVLMTRDDDRTVPLDQRAALANNNKADLFLSIHANASVRGALAGAEVFYLGAERYTEDGPREGESTAVAMPVFGGGTREIDVILWETAQAQFIERSAVFAGFIEEALRRTVPMSPRALQQAPFRALVGAAMPAALVEVGYLSNPDQERQLRSGDYQGRLAQALLDAIVRFDARLRAAQPAVAPVAPERPAP